MIDYLQHLEIGSIWIHHDATADLDAAVAPGLTATRTELYQKLKGDFGTLASTTVSTSRIQAYRQSIIELVFELVRSGKFANTCHQLLKDPSHIFTHSANVAFLSLLVGLEMETYVVRQRPRLAPAHARDMVPLGLGAMLHDIGKLGLTNQVRSHHETDGPGEDPDLSDTYCDHPLNGYRMLRDIRLPATARQIVLNHHQRFDGSGWPDQAMITGGRREGPQSEGAIHVFCRIVAAANVFDNLLNAAEGVSRPAVAALREFAGPRFDGWFDPRIRDLMIRRIPPFPIGAQVRLSDGSQAVVVGLNFQQPCRPSVRLLEEGRRSESGEMPLIDLEHASELHIVECTGSPVEEYLFELQKIEPASRGTAEPKPEQGSDKDTLAESA